MPGHDNRQMKKTAIIQSSYIPWKGYFDIINSADEFVILDSVQYTRRDWRNRNIIKIGNDTVWLTIPVNSKGRYHQKVSEVTVAGGRWAQRHWQTIRNCYTHAPHFERYESSFAECLEKAGEMERLSDINVLFIKLITSLLGINTEIRDSAIYNPQGKGNELVLDLCIKTGTGRYITGPSAAAYIDEDTFSKAGIEIEWFGYAGYPVYKQLGSNFRHEVSIIDLIFNTGSEATKYMLSF